MNKLFLFCVFFFYCLFHKGQSQYYFYTTEKIQKMRAAALQKSDFDKAAQIKMELDKRDQEGAKIKELENSLDKNVREENYAEANVICNI